MAAAATGPKHGTPAAFIISVWERVFGVQVIHFVGGRLKNVHLLPIGVHRVFDDFEQKTRGDSDTKSQPCDRLAEP